jgi:hypothetical protein
MKNVEICGSCTSTSLSTQIYVVSVQKCYFQIIMVVLKLNQSKKKFKNRICPINGLIFSKIGFFISYFLLLSQFLCAEVKNQESGYFPTML